MFYVHFSHKKAMQTTTGQDGGQRMRGWLEGVEQTRDLVAHDTSSEGHCRGVVQGLSVQVCFANKNRIRNKSDNE